MVVYRAYYPIDSTLYLFQARREIEWVNHRRTIESERDALRQRIEQLQKELTEKHFNCEKTTAELQTLRADFAEAKYAQPVLLLSVELSFSFCLYEVICCF